MLKLRWIAFAKPLMRAGYAEVEDDFRDYAESLYLRHYDRYPAGYCAYCRRNGAIVVFYRALQPVLLSTDMMQPIANLPVTIFKFAMVSVCRMATISRGVLIITLCVLLPNISGACCFREEKHG